MIRLFNNKSETDFNHNEHILQPLKCEVIEEENGQFELEFESLLNNKIEVGSIIKAPTPRGEQLFRVYKPTHTLTKTTARARHIFYDLLSNFLEDSRPSMTSGSGALSSILGGTLYPHRFEGISNVETISTAYYVRKNPVQAMLGLDNCLVKKWGGYIKRDNFTIRHILQGNDRGYEIRYGKNLQGIREEIDDSKVITKIMPTWVVENVVQMLPEKYIDSPLINSYPFAKVAEIRIEVPESVADKQAYVRNEALKYFSEHDIDKPIVNYKVDFLSLRNISEYKDFVWFEELDLYDVVNIIVPKMNLSLKSNVISYRYDCIKERFNQIEIGNFTNSLAKNTSTLIKEIDSKIDVKASELEAKQKEATDKISGVTGGNIVIRRTADGKPYEILVMDTADMNTAEEVVRINKNGIGFSNNGVLGPYSVGITIDGHIVADFIDTGVLTANLIKAGVLSGGNGKVTLDMNTGALNIDGDLVYDPTTRKLQIKGWAEIDAATIKEGTINSARIPNLSADKITSGTMSADRIYGGTIDARTINVDYLNASNLNRGTVGTSINNKSGHMSNTSYSASMSGSATGFNANSSDVEFVYGSAPRLTVKGRIDANPPGGHHTFEIGGMSLSSSYGSCSIKPWVDGETQCLGGSYWGFPGVRTSKIEFNSKTVYVDGNGFLKV